MSVLKRPLFRQAGGPAQPMPQDMMPPGPPSAPPGPPPEQIAMLEQAEAQGMMQGEQMGAQYAQQMMQNLDSAEDAESVINAIRGNQKPLESRRMELASFVGSEDASATPESVLAMVQPVIMMTEQGAMDSGIGELMQGLVGDVDMQASGMDEGVGSLMMAGAPEAPAPQNFNQGGAVRSFNRGGGAFSGYSPTVNYRNPKANGMMPLLSDETSAIAEEFGSEALMAMAGRGQGEKEDAPRSTGLRGYYEEMLPLYQEMLGDTEEQRNYNKAQTYFDIAQAGLNLASGVDPRTGKSTAGQPLGSQIASAASQLAPAIQARAAEDRKFERQVQAGALDMAGQQYMLDKKLMGDLTTAQLAAAAAAGRVKPEERVVLDGEGNTVATLNIMDPEERALYDQYREDGRYTIKKLASGEAKPLTNWVIQSPDGSQSLVESFTDGNSYIGEDGKEVPMPLGLDGYSVARVGENEAVALQRAIKVQEKYRRILAEYEAYKAAESRGETPSMAPDPAANQADLSQIISSAAIRKDKIQDWEGNAVKTADFSEAMSHLNSKYAINAYEAALGGTGPIAALKSGINKYIGFLGEQSPESQEREFFRQHLRAIRFIGKVALVSNSRFPVAEMVLAADLFADPDTVFSDPEVEAQKLQTIKGITDQLYKHNLRELASGGLTAAERAEAESSLREVELLRKLLGDIPAVGSVYDPDRYGSDEDDDKAGTGGL